MEISRSPGDWNAEVAGQHTQIFLPPGDYSVENSDCVKASMQSHTSADRRDNIRLQEHFTQSSQSKGLHHSNVIKGQYCSSSLQVKYNIPVGYSNIQHSSDAYFIRGKASLEELSGMNHCCYICTVTESELTYYEESVLPSYIYVCVNGSPSSSFF